MRSAILEGCASCWDASKSGKKELYNDEKHLLAAAALSENVQVIATFAIYAREKVNMISNIKLCW